MRPPNHEAVLRARDRRRLESLVHQQGKLDARKRVLTRELRDRGATVIELSRALEVSRPTIYRWLRENGS